MKRRRLLSRAMLEVLELTSLIDFDNLGSTNWKVSPSPFGQLRDPTARTDQTVSCDLFSHDRSTETYVRIGGNLIEIRAILQVASSSQPMHAYTIHVLKNCWRSSVVPFSRDDFNIMLFRVVQTREEGFYRPGAAAAPPYYKY